MIVQLYRKHIPAGFRDWIYALFLNKVVLFVRHFKVNTISKLVYFFGFLIPDSDKKEAYRFIGKYGLSSYPGEYSLKYRTQKISVAFDEDKKLPYVMHARKRLYFPGIYNAGKVAEIYRSLIIEQDIDSAHRYVNAYKELKGKTLLDIGSAEGIFTLDTIEYVKHAYLFEVEQEWIEALRASFEPWKDKVTITQKYVGNANDSSHISIDAFMEDKEKDNLFLKMDIEGAEQSAIAGAFQTLKTGKNIHLAVCIYHKKEDPDVIGNILRSSGYQTEFTKGYIFWGHRLSKAVIRCYN